MTPADVDDQNLTAEEALSLVAEGSTLIILAQGDVALETYDAVFRACHPKPVKVGVYNAGDEVVQTIARPLALLRVGPSFQDAEPRLTVIMSDRQLFFGEQITLSTRTQMLHTEVYNILMPFDGHSLSSSVAQATPERRQIVQWLTGGGDRPPAAMDYAKLRTYPKARAITSVVGALLAVLAAFQPDIGLTEAAAALVLVGSVTLHFNLQTLQKRFGFAHV